MSTSTTLAQRERRALCDLMLTKGPDAPTRCEGWDAHDLACHLWLRETDPAAMAGMFVQPLSGVTDWRMRSLREKLPFADLVGRLRRGPRAASVFSLPGMDAKGNTLEYFVHHEDVRRAGTAPEAPRRLDGADQDEIWALLPGLAKLVLKPAGCGIMLQRSDQSTAPGIEPSVSAVRLGEPVVRVVGTPAELALFCFGRTTVAEVDLFGPADAVAELWTTPLGV